MLNAEDVPFVWSHDGDYQVAYDGSAAARSEAFDAWQAEVAHSRRIEPAAESLDMTGHQLTSGEDVSLRLVMLHMLHGYARHNGMRTSCARESTAPWGRDRGLPRPHVRRCRPSSSTGAS